MKNRRAHVTNAGMIGTLAVLTWWIAGCAPGERETASEEHGTAHWGYEAENGPDRWGSMNPEWAVCASGQEQSPIDLAGPRATELPELVIHIPGDREVGVLNQEGAIGALDNGHTIQINARSGERFEVGGKAYSLVQFHFHAPSEHTVEGEHFPMEIHFVHQADDGALAVMGLFVQEGAENPSIAPVWEQLAEAPGSETTVRIPPEFAEHLFSGEPGGVYHYLGSLTTPPCSEGVSWFLRRTPTRFSASQIEAFTAIYDHNNRPVQPLHARTVHLDEDPTVTIR